MRHFPKSLFRRLASVLVLCLLTANLAMASYVCPNLGAMLEVSTPANMEVADMPCAGMDMEKPVQCLQSQSGEQLALENFAAPAALSPASGGSITMVEVLPPFQTASPAPPDLTLAASTGPPYLQTQRLRI
jgi:hypothetical protein